MRKRKLKFIALLSIVTFSCSKSNADGFMTTFSNNPSLAIIEAIQWSNSSKYTPCFVKISVANLYYGFSYDGTIGQLVSPYNFEAIKIFMHDSETIFNIFTVDIEKYSSLEYGIFLQKADKAMPDDFKLSYTFNLNELLADIKRTEKNFDVYFTIEYTENLIDGSSRILNRNFSTTISFSGDSLSLSNIKYF